MPKIDYNCKNKLCIFAIASTLACAALAHADAPVSNPFAYYGPNGPSDASHTFAAHAPDVASDLEGSKGHFAVGIWNYRTWKRLHTVILPSPPNNIALSPDGRILAAVVEIDKNDHQLGFWDTETGKPRHIQEVPIVPQGQLLFTPNGRKIILGTFDSTVVWDARTYQVMFTLPHGNGGANGLAVTPDSRDLLVNYGASNNYRVASLWSLKTGKRVRTFSNALGPLSEYPAIFSPNGRLLATAGVVPNFKMPGLDAEGNAPSVDPFLGQIRMQIWNVQTGQVVAHLPGPYSLNDFWFTADSHNLVITDEDDHIGAWNLQTKRQIYRERLPNGEFWALPSGDTGVVGQGYVSVQLPHPAPDGATGKDIVAAFPGKIISINLRNGKMRTLHP